MHIPPDFTREEAKLYVVAYKCLKNSKMPEHKKMSSTNRMWWIQGFMNGVKFNQDFPNHAVDLEKEVIDLNKKTEPEAAPIMPEVKEQIGEQSNQKANPMD